MAQQTINIGIAPNTNTGDPIRTAFTKVNDNFTELYTFNLGQTAGSSTQGFVNYSATTKTAGQFYGGTTAPDSTTRLNFDGYFYATRFYGDGSQLTSLSAGNLSGTIPSAVLGNSSFNIGTTSIALNRASGTQSLTGVSIDGNAGTVTNGVYTSVSYADPAWITSLDKAKVGLGNVENTALSTWAGSTNITTIGAATATSLSVTGNLTVNGTTTTVNSTTVTIDDPILTLGGDTAPTVDDNKDRGIEFRWRNGTTNKLGFFGFDDSTGKFTFIPDATNTSEVFSGTKGTIDANLEWADVLNKPDPVVTVTLTGDVTGTANATLTDLGNGTISISTTVAADSVALGTDTTGNYVASVATTAPLSGGATGSEGGALTLSLASGYGDTQNPYASKTAKTFLAAPNGSAGAPTFRAIVAADVPTLNQNTTGNAATATTLQTARTINGTSFNGSTDITTANWGTSRTITIGSTGKSVNGSANVSWTLAEIGAQAAGSYLTAESDTLATVTARGNTATSVSISYFGVNNTTNTNGYGISLYNGAVAGEPTYGLMFQGTGTFGTHGAVSNAADWATYFTMNNDNGRGWIFRKAGTGNTSSISAGGVAQFDGSVRSPIFYDSNDTTYYVDPAGNGTRAAYLNGNLWINPKSESYGEGIAFNMPTQGVWGGIRWVRGGTQPANWAFGYFGNESNNDIGFHNGTNGWRLDHSFNNTATGSMRSPIFYDSNDTGYYANPASISSFYGLAIRGDSSSTDSANQIFFWGSGDSTTSAIGFKANGGEFPNPTGFGDGYNTYLTMDTDGRGWVFRRGNGSSDFNSAYNAGWILNNGVAQFNSSTRSPIFYDSNDTSYYVDANSTSVLYQVNMWGRLGVDNPTDYASAAVTGLTSAPLNAAAIYDVSVGTTSQFLPLTHQTAQYSSGYRTHLNTGLYKLASGWGDNSTGWYAALGGNDSYPTMHWRLTYGTDLYNSNGYVSVPGSTRSPIFYDSDNTGYYVDPASTARLNEIYGNNVYLDNGGWFRAYGTSGLYSQSYGNHFYATSDAYWNIGANNGSVAALLFRTGGHQGTVRGYVYADSSNSIGFLNSGGNWRLRVVGDDYTLSDGSSIRGQLFYDSNDTGYYVDAAGTTRLSTLNVIGDITVGVGQNSSNIYFTDSDEGTRRMHCNSNRIGFLSDSNNWGSYCGDGGEWYSDQSVRSPIFYDNNDTGYYWDGASTSKWNESNQNGWHTFNNYGLGVTGTYSSYRLQTVFAMGSDYRMSSAGDSTANMYGIAWSHPNAGTLGGANNLNDHGILIINNGGFRAAISSRAVFSADVRGTLFYDYNDTNYYVDPASTSYINSLYIAGGVGGLSNSSSYTEAAIEVRERGFGGAQDDTWATAPRISFHWGGRVASQIAMASNGRIHILNNPGNANEAFQSGNFYAPIFYDSDNTGYYVDGASTSNLNVLAVQRAYAGYDAGVTNSFSCSDWFRSSGATGWYNASYGGGIYMEDGTWVRVYNSKAFYVANEIAATGNVTAYYSDERLKTNLGNIPNALNAICSLNGFRYVNNEVAKNHGYTSDKVQLGVSAQEVEALFPEVVSLAPFDMHTDETTGEVTSKSGNNYKTVAYDKLVPVLIEAVKEQQKIIDAQEERINRLEKLVEKLTQ